MAAGESARAEVARVRRKIADLQRYADTFERGAIGEERTALALDELGSDWVVFHDLHWPGRRFASIDHVAIGPGGVFVIDSKNWSGDVQVKDGTLRQNGYNREKSLAGVADSSLALAGLLGPDAVHVHAVLCFVGQPQMRDSARDVLICSADNVVDMLTGFGAALSPEHVLEVATRLDGQVTPATRTERGYAPGPHQWVRRAPRVAPHPPPASPVRSVPRTPPRSRSLGVTRLVGFLVAAVLFVVLGIPVLATAGKLFAAVMVDAVAPEDTCEVVAASSSC